MGEEDRAGDRDPEEHGEGPGGQAGVLPDTPGADVAPPRHGARTPLFNAQHAARYERQQLIREYEEAHGCRFVVLIDVLFPDTVTVFEELVHDADPAQDLHLLLDTPGGDGETAIRVVRSAQARCRELTVIVPNQAKSAGTILLMGAHHILMGPTSDLGPVDPQFPTPSGLYSAKDLIAAVEHAEKTLAENPESYPLHVALLADFSAVMVQQARSALGRSADLVKEALKSHPGRTADEVAALAIALGKTLIDLPRDHGAVFGAKDAEEAGLPVVHADPRSEQWQAIWQLWAKYFALECFVCEGRLASQVSARGPYAF
jgi:Serine dehydrogenase proteinase